MYEVILLDAKTIIHCLDPIYQLYLVKSPDFF